MKRFLLFAYNACYADGGWCDYVADFDLPQEAVLWLQATKGLTSIQGDEQQQKVYAKDFVQLVDTETNQAFTANWCYSEDEYRSFLTILTTSN